MVQFGRLRQSRRRAVRQRAPHESATRASSSARISTWCWRRRRRSAGIQSGEIRFEILNLTNTAKFGNLSTNNAIDSSSFGRVDVQAGFMRIWQLSFRYRF